MNLTIDSTIFVEFVVNGTHQALCYDLLKTVYIKSSIVLYEPSILLFEFINAVDRSTNKPKNKIERNKRIEKTLEICNKFINRHNSHFLDLDVNLWKDWAKHTKNTFLHKTQDEIFLYIACKNKASLVTLDSQMILKPKCVAGDCKVISPYECLKLLK